MSLYDEGKGTGAWAWVVPTCLEEVVVGMGLGQGGSLYGQGSRAGGSASTKGGGHMTFD